ncbi:TDT family transporter [Micromonospora costi]|uniref:TDT family transporter n=1 Tax=Micromonospora costi TaxID=1530042 RepID=A0A3B0AD42_9ACTN|nr:TDT family transporter [Micromonospora costi]RKN58241.1 TDT family transporter [Micromonospora costi]
MRCQVAAVRIPPNFFGIPFGLAGLGNTWIVSGRNGTVPTWVGNGLLALAALTWLAVLVAYAAYTLPKPRALVGDMVDPIAGPFVSLAVITPTLLAAQGVVPYALGVGRVLVDVFLVLTVVYGGWITGQWIYGRIDIDQINPGYFLPTVAGGFIASIAASAVGQRTLADIMLGLGLICWLVLGSLILNRLFTRPTLPATLVPTLAIEVAPPALAGLALLARSGESIDVWVMLVFGYGLLLVLAQIRLLPLYLRLGFGPSFWSFTFAWSAVATSALHWISGTQPPGHRVYTFLVLAAISALIGGIAVRSVVAVTRGRFLPPPAPPAAP